MEELRVLELFCGIGGLHWALKEIGIPYTIVGALEINPTVLDTYALNFPLVPLMRRNIESVSADEVNAMHIDAIVMSPPCQPFCRTGAGQGLRDNRCSPLQNVLNILPSVNFKYLFLENVKGFEKSDARTILLDTLKRCDFQCQELLINSKDLKIPNSRLRYYLLAKHSSLGWCFDIRRNNILTELPKLKMRNDYFESVQDRLKKRWDHLKNTENRDAPTWTIQDILEKDEHVEKIYFLDDDKIKKYWSAIDIISPNSTNSCCFTKAYFQYLTGSGSLLDLRESGKGDEKKFFRYFTPREVSRLLCYPEELKFPKKHSAKQCFKALGNSVNVYVISLMFSLLFWRNEEMTEEVTVVDHV